MHALILAGGLGKRLRPYTENTPKPLLPILADEPIISIILRQLARDGFTRVTIGVNYLAEQIESFCGDGSKWGLAIDYVREPKPLHTMGPTTLITDLPDNLLVVNGDILANFDYALFFNSHIKEGARISVALTKRDVPIDFLVVSFDEKKRLTAFEEKPTHKISITNGITCLSKSVIQEMPQGEFYGLDDLLRDAMSRKEGVYTHESDGFWIDIGRPADYEYIREHPEIIKEIV